MSWAKKLLGDFAPFVYGKGLPKEKRTAGNVPVYGSNGIVGFHNQPLLSEPAVIIGRKGSVGEIHLTAGPSWPIDTTFYAESSDKADLNFLFYLLQTLPLKSNSDSAVPGLNRDYAHSLEVFVPEKPMQVCIGSILKSIDLKISSNNAVSKNLEDIAQIVFKSWFIDFDPVKAKMAGEKPVGMDDVTAALFSDSMEDSELGPIPRGWRVGTVGEICSVLVNGSTPSRSNSSFWDTSEVSWFKTGELSDGFLLESKESISESALTGSNVKILPKGSVLMAIYAAPTVGRLGILTHDSTFNQACTGMLARKEYGLPFLFLHLKNRRNWFNSFAIGAAQQNISKSIVEKCPVVISSEDIHEAFLAIAGPLFAEIECLTRQSEELANLRDALLPRLISGELQIPEEMLVS